MDWKQEQKDLVKELERCGVKRTQIARYLNEKFDTDEFNSEMIRGMLRRENGDASGGLHSDKPLK